VEDGAERGAREVGGSGGVLFRGCRIFAVGEIDVDAHVNGGVTAGENALAYPFTPFGYFIKKVVCPLPVLTPAGS